MTAYKAMMYILQINENVEALKSRNIGDTPDMLDATTLDLLVSYREFLVEALKRTPLVVNKDAD